MRPETQETGGFARVSSRPSSGPGRPGDEDDDADEQHPGREDELGPPVLTSRDDEHERHDVPQVDDPAGQRAGAEPDGADREREHRGHPHRVDRDEHLGALPAVRPHDRAGVGRHHELHEARRGDAPVKSMARKSRPLPRKTVENSRSSTSPSWSRTTPMNHRKAMPAKGTRWRLNRIRAPARGVLPQRVQAVVGERQPDHRHRGEQQHREHDPGHGRGPPAAPEAGGDPGRCGGHRHSIAAAGAPVERSAIGSPAPRCREGCFGAPPRGTTHGRQRTTTRLPTGMRSRGPDHVDGGVAQPGTAVRRGVRRDVRRAVHGDSRGGRSGGATARRASSSAGRRPRGRR